ncbi:MAG: hypothetical protein HY552_04220 [Elusimicrobia bacterium]|nr:hypothetical protein [Elusimicrobiota bacterium]
MPDAAVVHYGWLSLLPAAAAVAMAVKTRRVIESLLVGVALSVVVIDDRVHGAVHALVYLLPQTLSTLAGHAASATLKGVGLAKDSSRGQLLLSVVLLGAFIAVIEKSGGSRAFAERAARRIRSEAEAVLTCFAIGISIFTSAYFGILVSGTAMKPVFDRMRISREKLAFCCDSAAAPTKALIPVSGWIAFMITLLEENIPSIRAGEGLVGFLRTMPYNLYCWAVLGFIVLLALGAIPDFGPMKEAERRVKTQGLLHKPGSSPMLDPEAEKKALAHVRGGGVSDMMIPLTVSVLFLLALGVWDGFITRWHPGLPKTGVDSLTGMSTTFALGLLTALILYVRKGLMTAKEFLDFAFEGGKSTIIGAVIILLAVTLSDLMRAPAPEGLGASAFIVEATRSYIVAGWIPVLTFLISAILSFAMGTSWGVWAIMMPIAVPLALGAGMNPFLAAGAVLSGGAFGDHCSPISDTSVLSSLAANTDHMEHIRTQLPYAMAAAAFALAGYAVLGWMAAR